MSNEDDKEWRWAPTLRAAGMGLLILVVVGAVVAGWYYLGVKNYESFASKEDAVRYGDSFGSVNTLFLALAFAGVVVAIFLQMRELGLQRTELRLTKNELAKSATAHQQLVKLSATTSLLQTYLEEYKLNRQFHEEEYKRLMKDDPVKVQENVWYRTLVLRAELEAVRSGTKGPVGVSVEELRRREWLVQLRDTVMQFETGWEGSRDLNVDGEGEIYAFPAREALSGFATELEQLMERVVAVPEANKPDLEGLRQTASELSQVIAPDEWSSHDENDQRNPDPMAVPLHQQQGEALLERAKQFAVETITVAG